jgi:hypothetical protein
LSLHSLKASWFYSISFWLLNLTPGAFMAGTDYGDSLRSTLDVARKQILDLGRSAAATRQRAVVTLGHAEQALSLAENTLVRNQRDLETAMVINNMAVQGGALIQSADHLADLAKTAADSANSALSVAATSIKTLASAFDTLAESTAGVNAIASNDDLGSAMARSAKKAEDTANRADHTVEQLKAASLSASIQSAKSMAAAAATSINAVGSEIQDLVDRAGALLDATQQRVNDSMKQRAAAAQAKRAASTTYRQAKIDSEALDDGTTSMDGLLNGGLAVTAVAVTPSSPSATPPSATLTPPYLTATYTIPGASSDRCYFFALPENDAPGFSYSDAKTAVIEVDLQSSATGWTPTLATPGVRDTSRSKNTYTVNIAHSQTVPGDKPKFVTIAAGQSYQVFAYRVPREGPYAANASDLSSPSRAIEVMNPIPNLDQYRAAVVPSQDRTGTSTSPPTLFNVQVAVPADASTNIMEYRAFVLLEDVYLAVKDDAAVLARLLPASSYKKLSTLNANGGVNFAYEEGDTDAYGDIVAADANYEVLVMLVPKDADTMASALLPAQPVTGRTQPTPPLIPAAASSPASQTTPSSGAPVRTTTSAGKPTSESAAPNAGQTPSGTGAK